MDANTTTGHYSIIQFDELCVTADQDKGGHSGKFYRSYDSCF